MSLAEATVWILWKTKRIRPFTHESPAQLSVLQHDLHPRVPSPLPRKTNRGAIGEVDWVEVINVWSRGVSTSWHGCAPPVVTEWSGCENGNINDNEIDKNVTTAVEFLNNKVTVKLKTLFLNSPLKTTAELWLSRWDYAQMPSSSSWQKKKKRLRRAGVTAAPITAEADAVWWRNVA